MKMKTKFEREYQETLSDLNKKIKAAQARYSSLITNLPEYTELQKLKADKESVRVEKDPFTRERAIESAHCPHEILVVQHSNRFRQTTIGMYQMLKSWDRTRTDLGALFLEQHSCYDTDYGWDDPYNSFCQYAAFEGIWENRERISTTLKGFNENQIHSLALETLLTDLKLEALYLHDYCENDGRYRWVNEWFSYVPGEKRQ